MIFKAINLFIFEKMHIYLQVETLGDAVYMVAGGVPDRSPKHAENVAGLAIEIQEKSKELVHPLGQSSIRTRIGTIKLLTSTEYFGTYCTYCICANAFYKYPSWRIQQT